jgi:hypothetical protein
MSVDNDKLNPDAEAALRKLLLEIWSFQTKIEEAGIPESDWDMPLDGSEPPKNQELCDFFVALDGEAYRALKILGFESYEELEESVWAKKPKSEPVYEGTGILDLKVTGFKEASA